MKRALLFIITAVMILSMLSVFTFGATAVTYKITPSVFVCGPVYNIVWKTNVAGVGYVEYELDGNTYRVYDEEAGLVRTDDTTHTVSVPTEHLDKAGAYTVTTIGVESHSRGKVTYGESASHTCSFRGYQGQEEINMWAFSDIHGINKTLVKETADKLKANPDLLVLLGDIVTFLSYESYFDYIFDIAAYLTNGQIPIIYSRGNHETRGRFAETLARYLPTPDVDFCFNFDYGPISFIVTDYGEDKIDSQVEYNGVVDYENFRIDITNWLANMGGFSDDAQYRIAMCHGANINNHFGHNWTEIFSAYGADMMISGHHHAEALKFWWPAGYDAQSGQWAEAGRNKSYCIDFPIYFAGVHTTDANDNVKYKGSQLTFKDGKIHVHGINSGDETEVTDKVITAGMNVKDDITIKPLEKKPSTESMLEYAGTTQTSTDFNYITKPVVFDTGETYTIAWAVTEGTSSSGTVFVESDGVRYRFTDNVSGALSYNSNRVGFPGATSGDKNIHTVSIPKKYLENATYEVVTRHIIDTSYYTGMIRGSEITTGKIEFDGYDANEDTEINMLYLSDWDFANDFVSGTKSAARMADIIVSGGNLTSDFDTEADFTEYIRRMGSITSGKKPVVFVRGENETVGSYAYYLNELLKSRTGGLYTKVSFGPVSALVLDNSALYADSDARYNGLACFESVRKAQLDWLEDVDMDGAEYKLALSSMPELYDVFGYNYSEYLNRLGVDLAVTGHATTATFTPAGERALNYAVTSNPAYSSGSVGTMLTFNEGNIYIKSVNSSGVTNVRNTMTVDDNRVTAFADVNGTDWYADAVSYVASRNIMVGTSADTFSPDEDVSRGMAAVVLARLNDADLEKSYEHPFDDVAEDAYYANAVGWCYQNGVVIGTSETTYSPEDTLTREQLCKMLHNMYPDRYEQVDECSFADFDSVSGYAKTPVSTMTAAGIVDAMDETTFAPKAAATRKVLAQAIYNTQK